MPVERADGYQVEEHEQQVDAREIEKEHPRRGLVEQRDVVRYPPDEDVDAQRRQNQIREGAGEGDRRLGPTRDAGARG